MEQVESIEAVRAARAAYRQERVGVVLTMGALHAGHLALVKAARAENDRVIVSIFINPTQFLLSEDLTKYPRTREHDLQLLREAGVDLVFMPTPDLIYPPGYQTYIAVEQAASGLEGAARPGHFRGVATVVAKLFNLLQPTVSYFGQKDAQQVVVLRQMVRDLNFPVKIAVIPTVREPDGLAMSSRNGYLKPEQRTAAAVVHRAIRTVATTYDMGERDLNALRKAAFNILLDEPLARIDYVAFNDPKTLHGILAPTDAPILLSIAVLIGNTRLLDNALLPVSLNTRHMLTKYLGG